MREVPSIGIDTRRERPRLLVGVRSEHWGPTIMRSDDLGQSWDETPEGAIHFPDDNGGTWTSIADGLPTDFGFTVVTHPNRGDTLWLILVTADSERVPPGGQDVRRRGGLDLLVRSGAVIHIVPSIAGG